MDTQRVTRLINLMRQHTKNSAHPNMYNAITGGAPVAALVYGLAYIGYMSGFCCKGRDGVRYEAFVETYMRATRSGFDYTLIDVYESLRCNMLHGLIPGGSRKGKKVFTLIHGDGKNHLHGTVDAGGRVYVHVDTFCADVLAAGRDFMQAVEDAATNGNDPQLLESFWCRMERERYSTMVSV